MYNKHISNIEQLGFFWGTLDPFLFCVHHLDNYPAGNEDLGPSVSLQGRNLGQDFTLKDGWRMYHGTKIPGFPAHPHRGFETITIVLKGFVDHSDSHNAAGRYGEGDVQWMTAGSGLQHAEMFPLLNQNAPNPVELFQIWLNLPKAKKFVEPHYKMLWAEDVPTISEIDANGKRTDITVVAGKIADTIAPEPAPDSWAFDSNNEVGIWLIKMEAYARWTLEAASAETDRTVYFYRGSKLNIAGIELTPNHSAQLLAENPITFESGDKDAFILILQGKPIGEQVTKHGPFVMNTAEEIRLAYEDFRKTQFGGWQWKRSDTVHPINSGRFAKYADGTEESRKNS